MGWKLISRYRDPFFFIKCRSSRADHRIALRALSGRSPPRVEIFHGTKDKVIPMRMSRELAEAFPGFVKFHPVVVADHMSILSEPVREIIAAMNE
jgi:pimeloyl-ACP methyl ester carboxylesterase